LSVLGDLGVTPDGDTPMIEVWNKIDLMPPDAWRPAANGAGSHPVAVSALTGEGLDHLKAAIAAQLRMGRAVVALTLPASAGQDLAWLHAETQVLRIDTRPDGTLRLKVAVTPAQWPKFAGRFPKAARRIKPETPGRSRAAPPV
jgi:GTP-binding protein HflX